MLKLIYYDLKRLFANKLTLALSIITPVVTLLLFASAIVPLLFSNRVVDKTTVAVLIEDQDEYLRMVFEEVINTPTIEDVVVIELVDSRQTGIAMTEEGEAALFVLLPENGMQNFYYRRPSTVDLWISPHYEMENALFLPVFDHVVQMFNRSQLGLDYVLDEMLTFAETEESYTRFNDLMIMIGLRMLNRSSLYDLHGISPLGKFLPLEYYVSALFAMFLAFGIIPIVGYNVQDFQSTAFTRGVAHFRWQYTFVLTRVITGTLFILLVTTPMLIVGFVFFGANSIFAGSLPALVGMVVFAALVFSSLAALVSLVFRQVDGAIWFSFYLVMVFSLFGGVALPASYLPAWMNQAGAYSPIGAVMKLTGYALFDFDPSQMGFGLAILAGFLVVSIVFSVMLFKFRLHQ